MRLPSSTFPPLNAGPTQFPDVLPILVDVTTTTIMGNSTASAESHHHGLPDKDIGGILGGCVAGVLLAVAAVIGWHCWGHSIARKQRKQRKEEEAMRRVRDNTLQNAGAAVSSPRSYLYRPVFNARSESKVQFVQPGKNKDTSAKAKGKNGAMPPAEKLPTQKAGMMGDVAPPPENGRARHTRKGSNTSQKSLGKTTTPEITLPQPTRQNSSRSAQDQPPVDTMLLTPTARPSKPKPLRSAKPSRNLKDDSAGPSRPRQARQRSQNQLSQGEEDKHTSLVMAALGKRWSMLTRSSGSTDRPKPSRLSHASSASAYSQPPNQVGVPIGLAYGGE